MKSPSKFTIEQWWSEQYIRSLPVDERVVFLILKSLMPFSGVRDRMVAFKNIFLNMKDLQKAKNVMKLFCLHMQSVRTYETVTSFIFVKPLLLRTELSYPLKRRLARTGKLQRAGVCFQFITLEGFYNSYGINQLNKEEQRNENNQSMLETAAV